MFLLEEERNMELSLMASAGLSAHSPPRAAQPQALQEFQTVLPFHEGKPLKLISPQICTRGFDESCGTTHLLSTYNQLILPSPIEKLGPIDVHDSHHDPVYSSFGITEKCNRLERILKFLMSESSSAESRVLDISVLSDLIHMDGMTIDMSLQPSMDDKSLVYEYETDDCQHSLQSQKQFYVPEPLLDFAELSHDSVITVHPDGRLLFAGSGVEMKDLLSIVSEFSIQKTSTGVNQLPMLVPYFTRRGRGHSKLNDQAYTLNLQTQTIPPVKRPNNMELKTLHKKKKNRNAKNEQNLYRRNYSHACENLLSIILDKNSDSTAMLSLKKTGSEVSDLLTQLSAGIAGAGLAVMFSVLSKIVSSRAPLSSNKLLNVGVGLGLFWLSSAVYGLRDTIILISKNSSKAKLKDEEITGMVHRSIHEILFRTATLVAICLLRFR